MHFRRKLNTAWGLFRHSPLHLFRHLIGQWNRYLVYSARPENIEPPAAVAGRSFRKLSDHELEAAMQLDAFTENQLREFREAGFNGAYGVFSSEALAHICWLITSDRERAGTPVGLLPHEAEVTFCVTLASFRSQGIYPYAIRSICQTARSLGIELVLMKTASENKASQKGILAAGFAACGEIWVFNAPYLLGHPLIYRGFRRRADQSKQSRGPADSASPRV